MLSPGLPLAYEFTETGNVAESDAESVIPSVHEPAAAGVTVSVLLEIELDAMPEQPLAAYGGTPPEIVTAAGVDARWRERERSRHLHRYRDGRC